MQAMFTGADAVAEWIAIFASEQFGKVEETR